MSLIRPTDLSLGGPSLVLNPAEFSPANSPGSMFGAHLGKRHERLMGEGVPMELTYKNVLNQALAAISFDSQPISKVSTNPRLAISPRKWQTKSFQSLIYLKAIIGLIQRVLKSLKPARNGVS